LSAHTNDKDKPVLPHVFHYGHISVRKYSIQGDPFAPENAVRIHRIGYMVLLVLVQAQFWGCGLELERDQVLMIRGTNDDAS